MNICIFYFSGTGNTKKIVDLYAEQFSLKNCSVLTIAAEDYPNYMDSIDLEQYDEIGIAYPIHAFNAPSIVLDLARSLPVLKREKALFIIKTSGEPLALNNISSLKLKSILKRKNLSVTNEYHYCMPYNIIFRHAESTAYKMYEYAKRVIPLDAAEILAGVTAKLPSVFCGRLLAWIFRIEHWGGRVNGKKYAVNDSCLHCLKCVRDCPVHNIRFDGKAFEFGKECLMCMRCSFNCPKNAIKIGMFDKWKVNGDYAFRESTDEEAHAKYCKRAYAKYFEKIDAKLAKGKPDDRQHAQT